MEQTEPSRNETSEEYQEIPCDPAKKSVNKIYNKKSNRTDEENDNCAKETKATPQREVGKTVSFSDTQIDISDSDTENETRDSVSKVNSTNPRITISEPVNSPCESEKREREVRGRCPIYYGIKSYLHDFYQPPDKEALKSGEFIQEDDFQFLVEPGVRRWRGWWLRGGVWLGINLMLIGLIAMLVGHLTTPRQTVVGQQDDYTILDRWAVTFNNRLVTCQLAGLAAFTCGAVVVMLALLVSSYQREQSCSYYVVGATVVPQAFAGKPLRIPLTGSLTGVQPSLHYY